MNESLYNLAFERSILSSIIFDPTQFDELESQLGVDDFYLPAHQDLYRIIGELNAKLLPIDEEFIKKELSREKKFDEAVMLDILSANPISNMKAYVTEIKEKGLKRHLLALTTEIKRVTLEEEHEASEVVDLVEKKLYDITQGAQSNDFKDAPTVTKATLAYIDEMRSRGDKILVGVDTGFHDLNKMTTGFGKGDLVILAARPAMGKTSLALNMVQNLLKQGEGVAFFSLEMPAEQLMLRMLSIETSIGLQKLRLGDMNADENRRLDDALNAMNNTKFFIDDGSGVNINQLRSKLRKLKTKNPEIAFCVIDYLQIMSAAGNKGRQEEVSEISRGLKMLARELEIPIMALSQLNRGVEARADKRPMLSDIRESGAIEQDADIIMFVYRDDVYLYKEEKEREKEAIKNNVEFIPTYIEKDEEEAEIIIGKQRNGPTGHVKLTFQKKFTRFVDAPTFGATEIVYESIDTKEAEMNIIDPDAPSSNVSMPII